MPAPVFAEIGISATRSEVDGMPAHLLLKTDESAMRPLKSPENSLSGPGDTNVHVTSLFSSSETMKFNVLTLLLTPEMSVLLSRMTSF